MKLDWKSCIRIAATGLGLYLIIYYWGAVSGFAALVFSAAAPLFMGCMISYIVNIPMAFYERHYFPNAKSIILKKTRRPACMLLAFISIAAVVVSVINLILPELAASIQVMTKEIPPAIERIAAELSKNQFLADYIPKEYDTDLLGNINLQDVLERFFTIVGGSIGSVFNILGTAFSTVTSLVLSIIISIYLLSGKEKLGDHITKLFDVYVKKSWNDKLRYVLSALNDNFHKFIVGQCTEAVILGLLCSVGMSVFRFPYAVMIGVFIGFMALIPFAGAYIGAAVGAFMILTVSVSQMWMFLIFIIVLQQLENNLIYPKIVGTSIGLPGIWVLCVITIGGSLMGIWGMLIAVPIASAAYQLLKNDILKRSRAKEIKPDKTKDLFGNYK